MIYSVEYILLLIISVREYIFLQKTWEIQGQETARSNLLRAVDSDFDDIAGHKVYIYVDIKDGNRGPQNTITWFSKA